MNSSYALDKSNAKALGVCAGLARTTGWDPLLIRVGAINRFYAERMATLGVPFIDTRPITSDAQGQYAAHLDDPASGERTLVRAGDGIHMSMTGYKWITRDLSDRIQRSVEDARKANEEAAVVARL